MRNYSHLGVQVADILLPKPGVDLHKWAVIACDQFTSQPEYWQEVEDLVGNAPSTYHMTLPEVLLGTEEETARVASAQKAMRDTLDQGLLTNYEGLIYVERETAGKMRRGLMLALDLEHYDYNKGSRTLIRATEGTIIDRLPPRMKIRRGAALEFPHILVLIDDPSDSVLGQAQSASKNMAPLYDFELMQGSGHLRGYHLADLELEKSILNSIECLRDPNVYTKKYGVSAEEGILLFAMGDGNHSLATAKAVWEELKPTVGMDHPARYALVEIENVHDAGLDFEPIHRVLFGCKGNPLAHLPLHHTANQEEMIAAVNAQSAAGHTIGIISPEGFGYVVIENPISNLPVGSLQPILDEFIKDCGADKIDYVHGDDVVCELGSQPGHMGFYLPAMNKSDLFKTVILDGALPRKTFSMGEAEEKRFYMEARRIA